MWSFRGCCECGLQLGDCWVGPELGLTLRSGRGGPGLGMSSPGLTEASQTDLGCGAPSLEMR